MAKNKAYLSLGSNIENRKNNLEIAIKEIEKLGIIIKKSSIYETEPVDYKNQPSFLNSALLLETDLSPAELIIKLQEIEHKMGRVKEIEKGPRNIDLDIIFYNNEIVREKHLRIPHPSYHKRNFVLTPLAEIEPEYTDPINHKSVSNLKETIINPEKVTLWT
ncbi:MAG: 2-amino-4-hydroxy-6-hydroxymethyldihydropteridine diphosphokinase [Candidatus Peregrinibacteria bacterium]|nr:2-amino-4-hydroxy-6-hydroxymethyldihydropteridine diphosphokinase [Candidatus Peregrinibacteria bacterium]